MRQNHSFLVPTFTAALGGLVFLTGCYVATGSKTEWEDRTYDQDQDSRYGSMAGAKSMVYRHELWDTDDGSRLAVGLFPGFGWALVQDAPPENHFAHGSKSKADAYVMTVLGIPIGNAFLGVPTLFALLDDPFRQTPDHNGLSSIGLFGAYRWKEKGGYQFVRTDYSENVMIASEGGTAQAYYCWPTTTAKDGAVEWTYDPGFAAIQSQVASTGKARVIFDDGRKVREYRKPKYLAEAVAYSDREATSEEAALYARYDAYFRIWKQRQDMQAVYHGELAAFHGPLVELIDCELERKRRARASADGSEELRNLVEGLSEAMKRESYVAAYRDFLSDPQTESLSEKRAAELLAGLQETKPGAVAAVEQTVAAAIDASKRQEAEFVAAVDAQIKTAKEADAKADADERASLAENLKQHLEEMDRLGRMSFDERTNGVEVVHTMSHSAVPAVSAGNAWVAAAKRVAGTVDSWESEEPASDVCVRRRMRGATSGDGLTVVGVKPRHVYYVFVPSPESHALWLHKAARAALQDARRLRSVDTLNLIILGESADLQTCLFDDDSAATTESTDLIEKRVAYFTCRGEVSSAEIIRQVKGLAAKAPAEIILFCPTGKAQVAGVLGNEVLVLDAEDGSTNEALTSRISGFRDQLLERSLQESPVVVKEVTNGDGSVVTAPATVKLENGKIDVSVRFYRPEEDVTVSLLQDGMRAVRALDVGFKLAKHERILQQEREARRLEREAALQARLEREERERLERIKREEREERERRERQARMERERQAQMERERQAQREREELERREKRRREELERKERERQERENKSRRLFNW